MINIYRTPQKEIQQYYDSSAINQSLLKTLLKGPHAYQQALSVPEKELYYEEKGHFLVGSAIDCYITQGEEEYKNIYYVANSNCKPKSDTIKSIIKYAFDKFAIYLLNEKIIDNIPTSEQVIELLSTDTWNIFLHEACNNEQYYMNRAKISWTEDGRLETVRKDNMINYVCDLFKSLGKQILTDEESTLINSIIMSLLTHPNTREYFNPSINKGKQDEQDDIDLYFQLPIYFDYSSNDNLINSNKIETIINENDEILVACKGLLDLLIVNHTRKIIIPIDIKTTMYEPYNFLYAVKDRRYDIQDAFYTYGINKWNTYNYEIKDFRFIVESNNAAIIGTPLVHIAGKSILEMGFYGRPEGKMHIQIQGQLSDNCDASVPYGQIKGIKQLFEDYNYYMYNGFSKRKEIAEHGEFTMEWSKIYPNN